MLLLLEAQTMFRWIFVTVLLSASAVAAVWVLVPHVTSASATPPATTGDVTEKKKPAAAPPEKAPPPSRQTSVPTGAPSQPAVYVYHRENSQGLLEPVLIPDCLLKIVEAQEVASEKEGIILFIGTDVQRGEIVPPDKQLPEAKLGFLAIVVGERPIEGEDCFQVANDPKTWYRRWRVTDQLEPEKISLFKERRVVRKLQVGDRVERGQLLAQVNPDKSSDNVMQKIAKLNAAERKRQAAYKTMKEYARRLSNYHDVNRRQPGAIQMDQLMETELQKVKAEQEERVEQAEIVVAQRELNDAVTDLKKHEIHAAIPGIVKEIYKNHQGDAVKQLDPILRIENPARLRAEGHLPIEEALKLSVGMTAIVEASRPERPRLVLSGHLGTVNCVAVSKGKRPVIVSGSDDKTLRGWDPITGDMLWTVWPLPSPVRSVACTPPASKYNLACFGCADGTVRLIDLDHLGQQKLRELSERHTRPVLGVAFSPDGEVIATCGDDGAIRLWKTESGDLLCTRTGHAGPVTSVQFASAKRLVSAGKDGRLIVWDVEDVNRTHQVFPRFDNRGGQVSSLGVSPDGKTVLFDQGKEIRLLTLENKDLVGTLQNPSGQMNFSTMALFSPDGKTILTNHSGSSPEKLQLWRTPVAPQTRGSELRQFIWKGAATCGAFAPEDGSFAVTGTEDHKVLVWSMPSKEEIDSRLEARLTLVEKYIDTQNRDVRVWAELQAPEWLIPGMRATMVVLPPRK
jgi:WD40 repeat protein/biotin carboxyl carrier protein